MTLAGNNIRVRIWRVNYTNDDSVGGAVVTGTYIGSYPARLQANPEEQIILQQGLETERTFKLNIAPGYLDIRERDEITVIAPTDHVYYNKWFRVRGVSYSSLNKRDPRNYMMLTLSISVRAHSGDAILQVPGDIVAPTTPLLYDRILALSPTIFNPLGDTSSPLLDVMGNGGHLYITGTVTGMKAFAQPGLGDGRLSLMVGSGTAGIWSATYRTFQTPDSAMTVGMYMKFISPYLGDAIVKTIMRLCYRAPTSYIEWATPFGVANTMRMVYDGQGTVDLVTLSGLDYNWHSYFWTVNKSNDRFRAYYDGNLIGEVNTLGTLTPVLGANSAFLGDSSGQPTSAILNAYLQYHMMWASKELTQTEIASISTI